jgi:hypothetical protein
VVKGNEWAPKATIGLQTVQFKSEQMTPNATIGLRTVQVQERANGRQMQQSGCGRRKFKSEQMGAKGNNRAADGASSRSSGRCKFLLLTADCQLSRRSSQPAL